MRSLIWGFIYYQTGLGFHNLLWPVCRAFSINKVVNSLFRCCFIFFSQYVSLTMFLSTVKPVLSGHSKGDQNLVFKTDYCLMQVISIAECSLWSILQYFRPSLSYHLLLRSLFCLFLSGRLRRVLLYMFMCRFIISLSALILSIFFLCFCLYMFLCRFIISSASH